jgi:hypothetical protein
VAITFLGAVASVSTGDTVSLTMAQDIGTSYGIVAIEANELGGTGGSFGDDKGNAYTSDDPGFGIASTNFIRVWRTGPVATPLAVGDKINCNVGTSQQGAFAAWAFNDWAGNDGTNGTNNAEGRATASTAPSDNLQSSVTTNANDVLFGAIMANDNVTLSGVTAGWNAESTASVLSGASTLYSGKFVKLWPFSQTVAAAGTYHLAGTLSGTGSTWLLVVGQYKYTVPVAPAMPPLRSPVWKPTFVYMRKREGKVRL